MYCSPRPQLGRLAPCLSEHHHLLEASATIHCLLPPHLQRAGEAGQLFVTATANNAVDLDVEPQYPGALDLPNVISTASTGPDDSLSHFSNYGR